MGEVRRSVIAGTWYPGESKALTREVRRYLDNASVGNLPGKLMGLVVPHAGYLYSGGVAAYAYKLLERCPIPRVIIIGPSHHAYFQGASVYTRGGYETPLGVVELDGEVITKLSQHSHVVKDLPEVHRKEHSLEIQLPFLQVVLGSALRLTPIVVGLQSYETCEQLARAVAAACEGKDVLIIASSDLSHYHTEEEARKLDGVIAARVQAFDPEGLYEEVARGAAEACGAGPVVATMLACRLRGAVMAQVLRYATSAEVTGDRRNVVGYLAAAFFGDAGCGCTGRSVGVDLGLSADEKGALRSLARETIQAMLERKPLPEIAYPTEKLRERRGAFVTIRKDGELRGCIGMVEGYKPLWETVREMAIQAAFHDPRFAPLQPEEFPHIAVEISVLTPLVRIQHISEVHVGVHGLVVRRGFQSGLLLPQVATEHGLDRQTFVEWTCRKAGLPPSAWREREVELYTFSADVF